MNSTSYFERLGTILFLVILISGCMKEPVNVLQVGDKAPAFTLDLLDGNKGQLDLYSGKSLAITFMSSWCPCSNQSIPIMKKAYNDNQANGLVFLMVGIQDSREKFAKFVDKWEIPFPAGYDKGDRIARNYGVNAPPTTIFIDRDGNVKRVFYGNIKDKQKEFPQWIEEIL
jgi:peroxiredoxin